MPVVGFRQPVCMVEPGAKLVYTTLLYKLNTELADALTKYGSEQFTRSMEVKPVSVLTAVITVSPLTVTGPYTLVIPVLMMFVVVTEFEA